MPSGGCLHFVHWSKRTVHRPFSLPNSNPNKSMERGGHPSVPCGGFDSMDDIWNAQSMLNNVVDTLVNEPIPIPRLPTPSSSVAGQHPPASASLAGALMGGYQSRFQPPARLTSVNPPGPSSSSRQTSLSRLRAQQGLSSNHFGRRHPRVPISSSIVSTPVLPAPQLPRIFEALVAVIPVAVMPTDSVNVEEDERFQGQLFYPQDRIESALARFQHFKLLAPVSIPFDTLSTSFYEQFSQQFVHYLTENGWKLPPVPATGSAFERKPFRILVPTRRNNRVLLANPRTTLVSTTFNAQTLSNQPYGRAVPNTMETSGSQIVIFAYFPGVHNYSLACIAALLTGSWKDGKHKPLISLKARQWSAGLVAQRFQETIDSDYEEDLPSPNHLYRHVLSVSSPGTPTLLGGAMPPNTLDEDGDMHLAVQNSLQTYNQESAHSGGGSSSSGAGITMTGAGPSLGPAAQPVTSASTSSGIGLGLTLEPELPTRQIPTIPLANAHIAPHRQPAYLRDISAVLEAFSHLEAHYPDPQGRNDRFMFTQRGGTVQQAVSYFLEFLSTFASKSNNLPPPPIDVDNNWQDIVEHQPTSIAGLIQEGHQSWSLEPAFGEGVGAAIVSEAAVKVFTDKRYFTLNSWTGSYTPSLGFANSEGRDLERERFYTTAGLLAALHMIWRRTGPASLSPIFGQAVIGGWDSLDNDSLLLAVCPDFRDKYLALSQHPLDQEVSEGSALHVLIEPILCGKGDGATFIQILAPHIRDIAPVMWSRQSPPPDVLLEHLVFLPLVDQDIQGPNPARPSLSRQEEAIVAAIKIYLQGYGHPDCILLRDIISSSEYNRQKHNQLLRGGLLLLAATGCPFCPVEEDWSITFELTPVPGKDAVRNTPKPMEWHLCTRGVTIYYDDNLVNACLEPIPSQNPHFSRRFDRWFHSQILDLEKSGTFSFL
ncbi:hypothetical protein BDV93DRAFT_591017 [Ceratobasidium sp. AG-I]|nr:hypothetical protein BDV93DRAFT_591017 [Ceratobasidium sp. AG-I]